MTIFGFEIHLRPSHAAALHGAPRTHTVSSGQQTLAALLPGCQSRVAGFGPALSPEQRAHLQAYGVIPGHVIQVVQHNPVTVAQIEHTELALEAGVAEQIWLESL